MSAASQPLVASAPKTWTNASIRAVRALTPSICEIELLPDEGVLSWSPGSHIDVAIGPESAGVTRSYSLIAGDAGDDVYRIAVKRLPNSRGGSRFMHELVPGASLRVGRPVNSFVLNHEAADYLLVGAGIGITPLVSMVLALKRRAARVRLVYGVREAQELAYGELLQRELGAALHVRCSARGERIDVAAELARLPGDAEAYVCGPRSLLTDVRAAWQQAGRDPTLLRFETFASDDGCATQPFRVRLPRHGVDVTVRANETLLDALLHAGVDVLHECRRGECGLCTMQVDEIDGHLEHRDLFLSAQQQREGRKLCVCVSRAVGSVVLDSAYRPD